jgi:hypothetical protein
MACVNQTRPHCVNQMAKTQSKLLAARHGRGTAWELHGMSELVSRFPFCERDYVGRKWDGSTFNYELF